ncbi:MAG TPA: hypothetical protein VF079_02235 [Sphingomicrobium sp.]
MENSILGLLAAAALASEGTPQVLARLRGRQFARMGIVAELVKRPAGISDEAFAQRLIDAEGLRPWNGKQFEMPARKGGMAAKAVFSVDGRELHVNYIEGAGRVCRIRFAHGGVTPERWKAIRWCASAFGIELPAKIPPPVVVISKPNL